MAMENFKPNRNDIFMLSMCICGFGGVTGFNLGFLFAMELHCTNTCCL